MILLALLESLAITGGTVHTLVPGSTPVVATVLVENDRIVAVGADIAIPPDAKRFDATGKHVIPGLIDAFVNHDPDHDRLYTSAGVTLVRDVGNDMTRILAETDRNARERSPGPWIWCAGAVLDGVPPSTTAAVVLADAAEAAAKIPRILEIEGGVIDYLSFHDGLAEAPWRKVLEIAHANHKQVWGPVPKGLPSKPDAAPKVLNLSDVIDAGQDGLYHLEAFLPAGKSWDAVTLDEMMPAIEKAGAKKLAITPTLGVFAKRVLPPRENPPELAYLGPFYVQTWMSEYETRRKSFEFKSFAEAGLKVLKVQGELVRALHDKGARIVPGSASPNPWLLPGDALLDELLLLRRAGIPDAEVLRLATAGAAATIGAEKRGTIEKGKIADLVLTSGDPAADLTNLHDPAAVVLRGRVLERKELDGLKKDLADRVDKLRSEWEKPIAVADPELPPGDVVLSGWVETRAIGSRLSAEKYVVVRRYDGSLTYSGRVLVLGQASVAATETSVQQTIAGGDLVSFDVSIKVGSQTKTMHGENVAGRTNIERRIDGNFIENSAVNDRISFLDMGSVTGLLVLGYQRKAGYMKVLTLADDEPALLDWEMRIDKDGRTHLVRTPMGEMTIAYDEHGAVLDVRRTAGNGIVQTVSLVAKAHDGKGLPMPADKRATSAAAPAKEGDSKPAPKKDEGPAKVPPKKGGGG